MRIYLAALPTAAHRADGVYLELAGRGLRVVAATELPSAPTAAELNAAAAADLEALLAADVVVTCPGEPWEATFAESIGIPVVEAPGYGAWSDDEAADVLAELATRTAARP